MQGVLVLIVVLYIRYANSLTWNIVVARSNRLEFYDEGTLVYTATPTAHRIKWISYDPNHDRILFADQHNTENSVSSFDIGTKKTQSIIKKKANQYLTRFAYDPTTELLFGMDKYKLYSYSIKSICNNDVIGDLFIDFQSIVVREVAVDSHHGYIYSIVDNNIGRSLFNSSEREILIAGDFMVRQGLTIDTENIYWIESEEYNDGAFSIETADLTGKNRRTIYSETESNSSEYKLTVSNDFIFWGNSIENFFWQLPKNSTNDTDVKPDKISMTSTIPSCGSEDIAAYYEIQEQTQAISVCHNYCLQGNCKVNTEGKPECSCKVGYSGEWCEVKACHKHCLNNGVCVLDEEDNAVCQCTADYEGERCDIPICKDYCLEGNCSVSAEGQPQCRCKTGYTGDRCTVSLCHNYCVQGDCSVTAEGPKCRCEAGYSGKRCEVHACNGYGDCFLNKNNEPVCHCAGQYEGETDTVDRKGYYWLPMTNGILPPNAIDGGIEKNQATFVARTYHNGSLCPGKYVKANGKAYFPWSGSENIANDYEILCGVNAKWVKVNSNFIPHNAFIGGRTGRNDKLYGEPLYVARAVVDGELVCGKAYGRTYSCYLPYYTKVIVKTSYEILVMPDDEI